ncbi:nodal homolog 4-A-like [Archocentrus centrarchus]|uniref:nodal homolog 4-A-like n=1 Tax=Archocentrus centrarchus TaxID=63155 RepID=UPI0011EA4D29|nr:nodal homolog 4-A-like [Archocentrus centrarchus]XP_030599519.1 nodal homolog 4-A-like [Archocentrus centrarchus]XP_030599520.1 nodal homolog 4-A-like [Archocentrus centrarchus]
MSFAFIVMTFLLGSSMMMAFVLHPSREEPAAAANSPVSAHRCQSESWQSVRKSLLGLLNLQTEPRLPDGAVDSVREQWNRTFSILSHTARHTAAPAVPSYSASADNGNSANLKCCSVASEIFMKDLGWDSWVIHPLSLTFVQCAPCNSPTDTVQCPSYQFSARGANTQDQVPCCEPTSQEVVPIVYMDETGTAVISSMQLTLSCGCGTAHSQEPGKE